MKKDEPWLIIASNELNNYRSSCQNESKFAKMEVENSNETEPSGIWISVILPCGVWV
jgi:hypothetical protein